MKFIKGFSVVSPLISSPPATTYGTDAINGVDIEENIAALDKKDPFTTSVIKGDDEEDSPTSTAQNGVKQAEAITLVWSKNSLYWTYAFIFLIYFINTLQSSVSSNLTAYVVSDFSAHSLIPVTSIMSSIMSGVLQLPIAKILDIWGRAEGFAVMVFVATIGLVLMSLCQNVETYAAAQVFYAVGMSGMSYVLEIVVADTTTLRNRSLAFAFSSSPYIATTFAGPAVAQRFYNGPGFRWAFGCFAILTPILATPIFIILFVNQQKAKKLGVLVKESSGRTTQQSIWYYLLQFDAARVFLLSAGLAIFLLPFSLAGYENNKWQSASIITMIVIGGLLLIIFGLWERFFTPKAFIPYKLLFSKNTIGACLLSATLFVAFYCWDGYYTSYLQVVNNLSISQAGYISNIYTIGSCFWVIVVSYLIRITGSFKWLAWVAMPVQMLGGGLMIYFRQPNTNIGYVAMCQIFIAIAGGTLVICEQMAAMAVCEHGDIAAMLALLGLFASIGGAVGSSVSGAIWTNTLPGALFERLPGYAKSNATEIYGDITVQLSYEVGSEVRNAIIGAYAVAQQRMCIAGTAILVLGFVWISIWKNVNVMNMKQMKGTVF